MWCLAKSSFHRYYNKTGFSGLETHINNSYVNPLLQLLRFTPVVRNLALKHTATNCISESCLLCELGFLIDMLEKAEGANCQATNFLKAFTSVAERMLSLECFRIGLTCMIGSKSEVLEENPRSVSLALMIQIASRLLFENVSKDLHTRYSHAAEFDHVWYSSSACYCTHELLGFCN